MTPQGNLHRPMSFRQRRAIYAIAVGMAANPVKRLDEDTVKQLVGKHATNIIDALTHRGLIAYGERSYELTPDGEKVAQLVTPEFR